MNTRNGIRAANIALTIGMAFMAHDALKNPHDYTFAAFYLVMLGPGWFLKTTIVEWADQDTTP